MNPRGDEQHGKTPRTDALGPFILGSDTPLEDGYQLYKRMAELARQLERELAAAKVREETWSSLAVKHGEQLSIECAAKEEWRERAEKAEASLSATTRSDPLYDFAWVIEKKGATAVYWDGRGITFDYRSENAVRFARKEDAQLVLTWVLPHIGGGCHFDAYVSEHGWLKAAAPSQAEQPDGWRNQAEEAARYEEQPGAREVPFCPYGIDHTKNNCKHCGHLVMLGKIP